MSTVNLPPAIIQSGVRDCFGVVSHFFGPFVYSSDWYSVLRDSDFGTGWVGVFLSQDSGASSIEIDSANHIPDGVAYDVTQFGDDLNIVYQLNAGGAIRIKTFNVVSGLWGSVTVSGVSPDVGKFKSVCTSTGTVFVFYTKVINGTTTGLYYVGYQGGVWGTEQVINNTAGDKNFFNNVIIDPNDVSHIYVTENHPGSNDYDFIDIMMTAGEVISAPIVIQSGSGSNENFLIGQPTISGLKIFLPYFDATYVPFSNPMAIWIGNDYNSPTYAPLTPIVTDDLAGAGGDNSSEFFAASRSGVVYIFFIVLNYTDVNNVIDRLYYVSSDDEGVTWSDPVLFYDAVTNPQLEEPTLPPEDQDLHTLSVAILAGGLFGVQTALEENGFCTGYYLLNGDCEIIITPTPVANVVTMPSVRPGITVIYSEEFQGVDEAAPAGDMEYEIVAGALPTSFELSNGTSSSSTGPIVSSSGINIQGQPIISEYQSPVTTVVTMRVRLLQ